MAILQRRRLYRPPTTAQFTGWTCDAKRGGRSERGKPPVGFEPTTYALRKHRSTTELRWRRAGLAGGFLGKGSDKAAGDQGAGVGTGSAAAGNALGLKDRARPNRPWIRRQ